MDILNIFNELRHRGIVPTKKAVQDLCWRRHDMKQEDTNEILQHMIRGGKLLKVVEKKETCYRIMTNSETNFGDTQTNDDEEQNKPSFLEIVNLLFENLVEFRKEIRQEWSKTKLEPVTSNMKTRSFKVNWILNKR